MKQKIKIITPALIIIILLAIAHFSCTENRIASLFGNAQTSPLLNDVDSKRTFVVQKNFRKIFELYKDKVVFITTEQVVRVKRRFYDNPFFQDFYGWGQRRRGRRRPGGRSQVQKKKGLGTGFIISSDGYIATNHHVIKGVDRVKVKLQDTNYEAKIIGSDERTDLALLKIEPKKPLKPVFFGDSDKVQVGDWAVAIGNPFGLDKTFTVGVVSAIGRNDVDMMGGSHIQTDASINPGNSGGPLINVFGEVIGINRMIYSKSGGYMGIGFAIPVNIAQNILEQLKKHKKIKWGYIGISIVDIPENYAKKLGRDSVNGAYVGGVSEGGPAEKAGLRVGDLITKVNKKTIKKYKDLLGVIGLTPVGKTLKMTVWRNKQYVTLSVTVRERPNTWN